MTRPNSVLVPVLFAKPSVATVPVLRVTLVPDGGGAPHRSVKHPLETLEQTVWGDSRSLLSQVLPAFPSLDYYTIGYLYPPKDVDQFADEFPEGFSHLLAVLLAFYALGADQILRCDDFKTALAGWTASTYPSKGGGLLPVSRLEEKLLALFEERGEFERMGCPPVRRVILSAADKPAVASLLGLPPEEVDSPLRIAADAGRLVAARNGEDVVELHFARDMREAFGLVFGARLLARYRRALALRRLAKSRLAWGLAGVAVAMAVARALIASHGGVPTRVEVVGECAVRLLDDRSRTIWLRTFDHPVTAAVIYRDRHGRRMVAVGLNREAANGGRVVALDRRGREVWRFSAGERTPYPPVPRMTMGVTRILTSDLLEEPGDEIVFTAAGSFYPSRLCILSDEGRLLREMWHPGVVDGIRLVGNTKRVVLWGCNNDVSREFVERLRPDLDLPAGREDSYIRAVGCIEAEKIAGQCPPGKAAELPLAPFAWYKVVFPFGRRVRVALAARQPSPEGSEVMVDIEGNWAIFVSADGEVLGTEAANDAVGPAPVLIDLPFEEPSLSANGQLER